MAKLVLSVLFVTLLGEFTLGQKFLPKPALPPVRGQKVVLPPSFPGPPLLPPVPSPEFVERLTKAQLAFIRHHQTLQSADKTTYSPYACLPKYICIIQDKDGSKRTAVVNGLHPALRQLPEGKSKMNDAYIPGDALNAGRNSLDEIEDPETAFQNQQRLAQDDFLREQEFAEQLAIETEYQRREKERSSLRSPVSDSGEDSPESEEESGEQAQALGQGQVHGQYSQVTSDPGVPWTQSNLTRPPPRLGLLGKFKKAIFSPHNLPIAQISKPKNQGFFRRMLAHRGKRDITGGTVASPFLTELGPGIKSSEQCRILYNGCELSYDQIMQISEEGQVLIEGDDVTPKPKGGGYPHRIKLRPEDDELELAARIKNFQAKQKKKASIYKIRNKNHKLSQSPPKQSSVDEEGSDEDEEVEGGSSPVRRQKVVPSLPIRPMKFNWGRPLIYVDGVPQSPDFGVKKSTTPPPPPPPSTPPPPVFVGVPVYPKLNRTAIQTSIVHINGTHALEIKSPANKPYRPHRAAVLDKNGNPASFASVFTEIAGSSGGIHDYFDKIAQSVGGPPQKMSRATNSRPRKPNKPPKGFSKSEEDSEEEEEEEEEEELPERDQESQEEDEAKDEEEETEKVNEKEKEESEEAAANEDEVADEEPVVDDEEEVIKLKPKVTPEPPKDSYSIKGKTKKTKAKKTKSKKKKPTSAEDEPEGDLPEESDVGDEEPSPKKQKKTQKKKKGTKPTKEGVKEEDASEEYDSEEVRKRNKAADEVVLPEFLSDEVKHAIREGIRNGHKEDHGKPKEPEEDEKEKEKEEVSGGHPGYYGHYGDPSQYYSRPRPVKGLKKRPGLFSLFG